MLKAPSLSSSMRSTPREGLVPMGKLSKNYWRTRDNIDYHFFEARAQKLIIVCCQDMNSSDKRALKTVAVNMEMVYTILDGKKRESEEPIYKKAERGFENDTDLHKAALAYLEQRLIISKEPVRWPTYPPNVEKDGSEKSCQSETTQSDINVPMERMVTINKLSADKNTVEVPVELLSEKNVDMSSIDAALLKLTPTELDPTVEGTQVGAQGSDGIIEVSNSPVATLATNTAAEPTTAPAAPAPAAAPAAAAAPATALLLLLLLLQLLLLLLLLLQLPLPLLLPPPKPLRLPAMRFPPKSRRNPSQRPSRVPKVGK